MQNLKTHPKTKTKTQGWDAIHLPTRDHGPLELFRVVAHAGLVDPLDLVGHGIEA